MQIFKSGLLAAAATLLASPVLAADLAIENRTSHKIVAKLIVNPYQPEEQAYALTINGERVTSYEFALLEIAIADAGPADPDDKEAQEILELLKEPILFAKEDNQKVVFENDSNRCGIGGLRVKITSARNSTNHCIATQKTEQGGAVWLFFNI